MKFAKSDIYIPGYPQKLRSWVRCSRAQSFFGGEGDIASCAKPIYISRVLSQLDQIMSSKTQLSHPYASKAHSSNRPRVPKDARKRVASAYHWILSVIR